jgi:hypothetical protein
MKGVAHFSVGVALASCFQEAVRAGADGNPLYFILGGIFGLLPDTMDFKFYKFLYRYDCEITPDPDNPDPRMISEGLACVINTSFVDRKPLKVKLNTMRLGADLWRQYKVKFDVPGRRVIASIGPVVRTDQSVAEECPGGVRESSAILVCGIRPEYEVETTVDILDGPSFMMSPTGDGRVSPVFIPWHREWSHSIVIGFMLGLAGAVTWGLLAGTIIFMAYGAHIFLDQLGFLGSNLFFPFRQSSRTGGMKLVHSGDMLPNFSAVWLSCLAMFWNLYRSLPWQLESLNPLKLVFYGAVVPFMLFALFRRFLGRTEAGPMSG